MKILLFGKNGQIGWELQRSLAVLGTVVAVGRDTPGFAGDFSRPEELANTVLAVRPDVVVNAAAYTAVDQAEREPEAAKAINATAPAVLADAARRIGAWLVHYSTDYVFDGQGTAPFSESDATGPLNVYGRTKLAGEQQVQQLNPRHLILRTSWVYAARGSNFAKTMLRLAQERTELKVIVDQNGAPTGADLLADATAQAIRQLAEQAEGSARAGLYHLAASGEASWFEYARLVLQQAQSRGQRLQVLPDEIQPVASSAFATVAKRPHNSRLDTRKFQQTFGLELPVWQDGVRRMVEEIL
ncbi:dTDP-4-dehydrorhamnose reductase [Xylophilus sp. GW821-FHT01B05]